jgi:iron complex outermembrane receptor protein
MKKAFLLLALVLYVNILSAQNVLKGKVTDAQNQALNGVSVIEKGTNNGVFTDNDGNYTISYKNENSIIAFSFVGLTGQEVTVGKQAELNIMLIGENVLGMVEIVGSRRPDRTATESVVPVDIIEVSRLLSTLGQPDVIPTSNPEQMVPITLIQLHYAVLVPIRHLYLLMGSAGTSLRLLIFLVHVEGVTPERT